MASAQGTLLAALGGAAATLGAAHAYVRLEAAEKRGKAIEAELKAVQKDLACGREKAHERENKLAELEQRLKEAHVQNRDLQARLDQEHTARAQEQADSATMRGEFEQLVTQLERAKVASEASKQRWMSEKAALSQRFEGMMQTLSRQKTENEDLAGRLRELEIELASQQQATASAQEQLRREREEQAAATRKMEETMLEEKKQREEEQTLAAGAQEMLSRELDKVRYACGRRCKMLATESGDAASARPHSPSSYPLCPF
jgi:chromosome segregation ATPase